MLCWILGRDAGGPGFMKSWRATTRRSTRCGAARPPCSPPSRPQPATGIRRSSMRAAATTACYSSSVRARSLRRWLRVRKWTSRLRWLRAASTRRRFSEPNPKQNRWPVDTGRFLLAGRLTQQDRRNWIVRRAGCSFWIDRGPRLIKYLGHRSA